MLFKNIFTASAVFMLIILIQCCREENPVEDVTSITGYDSNSYKIIRTGNQIWVAENIKTTNLNDGTIIPIVTDIQDINIQKNYFPEVTFLIKK